MNVFATIAIATVEHVIHAENGHEISQNSKRVFAKSVVKTPIINFHFQRYLNLMPASKLSHSLVFCKLLAFKTSPTFSD